MVVDITWNGSGGWGHPLATQPTGRGARQPGEWSTESRRIKSILLDVSTEAPSSLALDLATDLGRRLDATIVAASSEDAVRFDALNDLLPSPGTRGYGTVLRSIKTPFIDELLARPDLAAQEAFQLLGVLRTAIQSGNVHEVMPTAGQSAGGIREVLPVAEIIRRMMSEAEEALASVPQPPRSWRRTGAADGWPSSSPAEMGLTHPAEQRSICVTCPIPRGCP